MRRPLKTLAAAAVLGLTLTGCATGDKTELEGGAKIIEEGKLTVCTHPPYEPFEMKRGDKYVGMDIDLMNLVADELGLDVEIFTTPFEGIESGQSLNVGDCDVAAAGMTITPERSKVMDFSDGYFEASQALLVKKGSGIDSLDDLAGKQVAVQVGTTGELYFNENAPEGVDKRVFEGSGLVTNAVKSGTVPAGIHDNSMLYDFVAENPDMEVSTEFDTGESYGFAVAKGENDALLETINDVLARIKKDGTYEEIYNKWFPEAPAS